MDAFIALVTAGNIVWKKKKPDFKSVFGNLFCLCYSGRNSGNGVIRACPLNVKNIVKREGQYNKFFSHKESKVT